MRPVSNKWLAAGAALILGAAAVAWHRFGTSLREERLEVLDPARVEIIRTPGGTLEVSAMEKVEAFGWRTSWECPILDCSKLPDTVSTVRVKAHYVYQVPLADEWRLEPAGDHYELTVPAIRLRRPVAFDTATMEIETRSGVFSPAAGPSREKAMRHISAELATRGAAASYLDAQRRAAEKTIEEFARKWMIEQGRKPARPIHVRIDEPSPL